MKRIVLLPLSTIILTGCLGPHVKSPHPEVPFVYPIGWWPYQSGLQIQKLEVQVLDSRLNLFNSKTLAEVIIKGEMKNRKGWRPVVTKAHLSERILNGGNFINSEAEIAVTPIVEVKKDEFYGGSSIPFSIRQEIILNSMGWGQNTFVVVCGNQKQSVTVHQAK